MLKKLRDFVVFLSCGLTQVFIQKFFSWCLRDKNPTAEDLIADEEENFIKRFETKLIKLAREGVAFNLPAVVVDHVADTEENLSWVKSKINRCSREGTKEGEGLKMFKIPPKYPQKKKVDPSSEPS